MLESLDLAPVELQQAIAELLLPVDVVALSRTCRRLHRSLASSSGLASHRFVARNLLLNRSTAHAYTTARLIRHPRRSPSCESHKDRPPLPEPPESSDQRHTIPRLLLDSPSQQQKASNEMTRSISCSSVASTKKGDMSLIAHVDASFDWGILPLSYWTCLLQHQGLTEASFARLGFYVDQQTTVFLTQSKIKNSKLVAALVASIGTEKSSWAARSNLFGALLLINTAVVRGHPRLLRRLLSVKHINDHFTSSPWRPVNSAVSNGHIGVVQVLQEFGAFECEDMNTVLMTCIGHPEILAFVINAVEPSVNLSFRGNQLLKSAVSRSDVPCAKLLVDAGVDPTYDNNDCIVQAALSGSVDMVKYLLDCGRGVNPGSRHSAALREAAKAGNVDVVSLLLTDYGRLVDPGARSSEAIRSACEHGHAEIVRLLLDRSQTDPTAYCNEALRLACKMGHANVVKVLLRSSKVREAVYDIEPLLVTAIERGSHRVIETLLTSDLCIDHNSVGKMGLRFARLKKTPRVAEVLLKHGKAFDLFTFPSPATRISVAQDTSRDASILASKSTGVDESCRSTVTVSAPVIFATTSAQVCTEPPSMKRTASLAKPGSRRSASVRAWGRRKVVVM